MVTKILLNLELGLFGTSTFRCVSTSDVSQLYVDSLNAETKYLETKPTEVTIQSQQEYIAAISKSNHQAIVGLFMSNGELVATAGMQNIHSPEASIGIFVFNGWRGKKMGKVLVWSACILLKQWIGICNYSAGMKSDNEASLKSFTGCGFTINALSTDGFGVRAHESELRQPKFISSYIIE